VVYASSETHTSVERAARTLGLGSAGLRLVPVDRAFEMDVAALTAAIHEDRAAGRQPICVVGNAGTVNTGATDNLAAIADLCAAEGLWFHVDGAFGALAALSPSLAPLVRGMERADSIAFDLHKWLYMPYNVGCTLVRDPVKHRQAFSPGSASYLTALERGTAAGEHNFSHLGPELSREFRALKVWLSLKEHGTDRYARQIEQNVAQARELGRMIGSEPELELLAPVALNIVCFRNRGGETDAEGVDAINREILMRVQERGVAVPSSTVLRGAFAIRVANTNHRSRREDFAALVAAVLEEGRRIRALA
jgi:glutamate/tyrosine decarboxylase-like PLP-dependent enzyme